MMSLAASLIVSASAWFLAVMLTTIDPCAKVMFTPMIRYVLRTSRNMSFSATLSVASKSRVANVSVTSTGLDAANVVGDAVVLAGVTAAVVATAVAVL